MHVDKKHLKVGGIIAILTALLFFGLRFVFVSANSVHYHANFGVFVDGERLPFDKFTFYEEVQSCGGEGSPKVRVHMHDSVSHVVHVHDDLVTWGHFFSNIGYAHGDTVFKTDESVYVEGDDLSISYVLNGEEVGATANRVIEDEDRLLISINSEQDVDLNEQFNQIEQDAEEYNKRTDPSACSGADVLTLSERIEKTYKFWE